MRHSTRYGFGLIDAHAAVRMAASMKQNIPPAVTYESTIDAHLNFPSKDTPAVLTKLVSSDLIVEHVQVSIDLHHSPIDDLQISLKSPGGTNSVLFGSRHAESVFLKITRPGVIVGEYEVTCATFGPKISVGGDYGDVSLPPNGNLCDDLPKGYTFIGTVLAHASGCAFIESVRRAMDHGAKVGVCDHSPSNRQFLF